MKRNKYGLDQVALEKIRRDQGDKCIYCHEAMYDPSKSISRRNWATIEHLHRKPPWNKILWVVFCCWSCNSSRRDKKLRDWFETGPRCKEKNITEKSVALIVKRYLSTSDSYI
jgi:hypothetical protein